MQAKKRPSRFRLPLNRIVMGILLIVVFFIGLNYLPSFYLMLIDFFNPISIRDELLSEDACRPSCWQGLIIGESTVEDVESYLQNTNHIPTWAIHKRQSAYGSSMYWNRPFWRETSFFYFDANQILQQVQLWTVANPILLRDIIRVYGEPTVTVAAILYPIDTPVQRRGLSGVALYYPTSGMIIRSNFDFEHEYGEENFTVPLNPSVSEIRFYEPEANFDEFMHHAYPAATALSAEDLLAREYYVSGWIGYGVTVHISSTDHSITLEPADR